MLNSAMSLEIHFKVILSIFDQYVLVWVGTAMTGHFSKTVQILIIRDFTEFDHLMGSKPEVAKSSSTFFFELEYFFLGLKKILETHKKNYSSNGVFSISRVY